LVRALAARRSQPEPEGVELHERGLSIEEVQARVAAGQTNAYSHQSSRRVRDIVRENIVTPFNAVLGALFVVMLVIGPVQDTLFGLVLVFNAAIGIAQELRAKLTLDRLLLVTAPTARVVRAGEVTEVPATEVVLEDLVRLRRGDQVVADGKILNSRGLELDESLLTGESKPAAKQPGDRVLSGTYVTGGSGSMRALKLGVEAYANQLTSEARRFRLARSELRTGINRLIATIAWSMPVAAVVLLVGQLQADEVTPGRLRTSVAGLVTLVPEGLVLLTSIAFAVAALRLARLGVVTEELDAIEGLSRVDVLCIDKTGTITDGRAEFQGIEPLSPRDGIEPVLAAMAAVEPDDNGILAVIALAMPAPPAWAAVSHVPFASDRGWSGVHFEEHGTWVLGGMETIARDAPGWDAARARAEAAEDGGARLLVLATTDRPLPAAGLPEALVPVALVLLRERVRPHAAATMAFLRRQGVAIKLISGDSPRTAVAVAERVGIATAGGGVDGSSLPEDAGKLADLAESTSVFGRVRPEGKKLLVRALQSRGHVVCMMGDGANDIPAMRAADLALAIGTGAPAARAAAQLVLLEGRFDGVPEILAQGRRVVANIERVARLFLTKSVYAFALILVTGVAGLPFPFYPRHMTLIAALTIGIPAFFLALAPNDRRSPGGFARRALVFAVPAGLVAAAATFAAYWIATEAEGATFAEQQTAAVVTLFGVGMTVLWVLVRPLTAARTALLAALVLAFVLLVAVPSLRPFLGIDFPRALVTVASIGLVATAAAALRLVTYAGERWLARGQGSPRRARE
jgi:cation-transporting ATPase E